MPRLHLRRSESMGYTLRIEALVRSAQDNLQASRFPGYEEVLDGPGDKRGEALPVLAEELGEARVLAIHLTESEHGFV